MLSAVRSWVTPEVLTTWRVTRQEGLLWSLWLGQEAS